MSSSSPKSDPSGVVVVSKSEESPSSSSVPGSGILLNIPRPPSLKQEDSDSEEDDASVLLEEGRLSSSPCSSTTASSLGGKLTLSTLIREDLIEPGEGVLSIDYLGQTFKGDLSPGGKIKSVETGLVFNNPSAWAIYCKKIVNPAKKSGCGWASVKYKGRKMDHYKNSWLKMKLERQTGTPSSAGASKEEIPEKTPPPAPQTPRPLSPNPPSTSAGIPVPASQPPSQPLPTPPKIILNPQQQLQLQQLKLVPPNHFVMDQSRIKDCILQHSQLGPKMHGDFLEALIEPEAFPNVGKIQPFTVSLSSSVSLIMDLHAHVHSKTVCGYLAGQWDINAHNVAITHVFPIPSKDPSNLGPKEAQEMEHNIYQNLYSKHLTLLGWYRTRPMADRALPSLKDCETQLDFQVKLLGTSDATYTPCIGMILSTYGSRSGNSDCLAYWVIPPPETNNGVQEYGKPMSMAYNVVSDPCLSSEVLDTINEVISHVEVPLHELLPGSGTETFISKLGATIVPKFPRDQDERLWRYIRNKLLKPEHRGMEDPIISSQVLFKSSSVSLAPGGGQAPDEEDEIDDDEENALKSTGEDVKPAHSIFPIKSTPFVLPSYPLDFSSKKDH